MGLRDSVGSVAVQSGIKIASMFGCKPVVEIEGPMLRISAEVPNNDKRAWDSSMLINGWIGVKGYANVILPRVSRTPNPKQPDELDVESNPEETQPLADAPEDVVFDAVPSYRYQEHQHQHVVRDLVNPSERLTLIILGLIGVGGLVLVNMIVVLYATGSF